MVWAISMPMKACFVPESVLDRWRESLAESGWNDYTALSRLFYGRPSLSVAPQYRTMWMPQASADFFNWNIAFTFVAVSPAWSAELQFEEFLSVDEERTIARIAKCEPIVGITHFASP